MFSQISLPIQNQFSPTTTYSLQIFTPFEFIFDFPVKIVQSYDLMKPI